MSYGNSNRFDETLFKQCSENSLVFYIDKENPHLLEIYDWLKDNASGFQIVQSKVINLWYEIVFKTADSAMLFKMTFV